MSALFLVLSASYFTMPQFRQAFTLPIMVREFGDRPIPSRFISLPETEGARWKADAEAKHDARALAFFALRAGGSEAGRLADLASTYDPKLTWVYYTLFNSNHGKMPDVALTWAKKIQQFEPDNALGYLAEAEYYQEKNKVLQATINPMKPEYELRLQQKEWADAMDKAFSAARYDSFNARRFDLERTFLHAHGYDTPVRMMYFVASYPISNLLNIRQYAKLRIDYLGKNAEKAGKSKEALDHYWAVAHFGERMQMGANFLIEQLIASAVQQIAYKPLSALLRSSGDTQAATSVDNALALLNVRIDEIRGKDILALNSGFVWNAILVNVFLGLTVVFTVLTVFSILYVNLKRWWRVHNQGTLYGGITIAENYFPVLLFIFCSALYITYYPYARNFSFYMTAQGDMHNLEAMSYNTISLPMVLPRFMTLNVGNPFVPYVWYALGALVTLLAVSFVLPGRKRAEESQVRGSSGQ